MPYVQIEQEIGLIVGKKDIRTAFETTWTTTYVPALLKYGQRSTKKALTDIYTKLVESGMYINLHLNVHAMQPITSH